MSYLLPNSLFRQKHLGNPSFFTLFSVHVLLCLGAGISGHWGYPFQATGNPFWKHCWRQGVKKHILLLSCLFLCSANFAFCSGLLFPISCLFDWAKVCSSAVSATPLQGASWDPSLCSLCLQAIQWALGHSCAVSEGGFEALVISLYGPFLHLVVGMDLPGDAPSGQKN